MRPDYCPIGGEPCQSLCVDPCGTTRRRVTYVCPVCAASMVEADEALLRQALEALEKFRHIMFAEAGCRWDGGDEAIAAIRARLEKPC